MKQSEFDPIAEGLYRDAMLEQYRECRQERPQSEAQKKAAKAGKAPNKAPARKPERKEPAARQEKSSQRKCTPKKAAVTSTSPAFSETYDYTLCQRPDGSYYGTAGQCRKGTPTTRSDKAPKGDKKVDRKAIIESIRQAGGETDKASAKLEKLTDSELSNVASNVSQLIGEKRGRNVGEMSWEQVKALESNRERLMEGYKDPSKLTGNLKKVSDAEADAFYSVLPKKTQESLNKAGALKNTQYLREDGTHGAASEWRGRQLAKRWLEQDGKDLYTGQPLKLVDADLEHIIPHKLGGNRSESLDNFGWIQYASNQRKASDSMEKFFEKKVDKPIAMGQDKYTKNVYGKAVAKAEKSAFLETKSPFYASNPREITKEAISQFGDKLYYVSREWGVKHGFKKDRASTRYFSEYNLPGFNEKFTQFVVRRWANATPAQRDGMKKVSEFTSRALTDGLPTDKVMTRAADEMRRLGLE